MLLRGSLFQFLPIICVLTARSQGIEGLFCGRTQWVILRTTAAASPEPGHLVKVDATKAAIIIVYDATFIAFSVHSGPVLDIFFKNV